MILPNQDFLELELSSFLNKSQLGKYYTVDLGEVKEFKEKHKEKISGYQVHNGDGVYLLDDEYEIIVRKVSKKRLENAYIAGYKYNMEAQNLVFDSAMKIVAQNLFHKWYKSQMK